MLLSDGSLRVCDVGIRDRLISETGSGLSAANEIDADGCYVLPGLIDLHTHGIGKTTVDDADLVEYARLEAARGATTFFPTLFAPPQKTAQTMRRLRRETDELKEVPGVAGFRLESPYLAGTGAGLDSDLAAISDETTDMLLDAGGGHIRIWDVSPELPGSYDLISCLSAVGIVCSIAHTTCTIDQAREAVRAGARLVTHMFDTFYQAPMKDPGVYPASLVDYLLVEDSLTCEIIADGTHVHPILVEIALRCKGVERLAFVTDSNLGAGLAPGEYDLPNNWGRARISEPNDGVRLVDRGMSLAGSALTPIDAFRNAAGMFGQDIAAASRLCAKTPAQLLGLNKGEIAVGRDADIIILDGDLNLVGVIIGGKMTVQRGDCK